MRRRTATAYRLRPGSVEDLANSDGTFVLTATRKGIRLRALEPVSPAPALTDHTNNCIVCA